MRSITKILFIFCISFIVISCSNINDDLIQKLHIFYTDSLLTIKLLHDTDFTTEYLRDKNWLSTYYYDELRIRNFNSRNIMILDTFEVDSLSHTIPVKKIVFLSSLGASMQIDVFYFIRKYGKWRLDRRRWYKNVSKLCGTVD